MTEGHDCMRLVLMRHGATAGNEARRYVGRRTDEPLSDKGVEQCHRAGTFERVDKVYASSMLRARQTARLCFPRAEVVPVPGLEEFDFGDFEGRCPDDMEDDAAYRAWVNSNCEAPCPGGEARSDFARRTCCALEDLVRAAWSRGERLVVVVAHGGTIMAALDGFYDKHVGNCEGYVAAVRFEDEGVAYADLRRFDPCATGDFLGAPV
jgi:alpha-ribazole phosphatase